MVEKNCAERAKSAGEREDFWRIPNGSGMFMDYEVIEVACVWSGPGRNLEKVFLKVMRRVSRLNSNKRMTED